MMTLGDSALTIHGQQLRLLWQRAAFLLKHVAFNWPRVTNLLAYKWMARRRTEVLRYLPYRLDVEPTTQCNFRCTMCHVSDPSWTGTSMSLDDFRKLVDANPQVFKIKLQGMGEPFLNNKFLDMAGYAAARGVYVTTTTNGSALTPRIVGRLLDEGSLREVIVSLDGAGKTTFETIRVGSKFERVIDNVSLLIAENSKRPRLRRAFICAWTVLQKDNWHERFPIVELAARLGFDRLTFQVTVCSWGKDEWRKNKSKQRQLDATEEAALKQHARKRGLWLEIYRENLIPKGVPCPWPFESAYVGAQLDVVPCCSVADPRVANMGHPTSASLADVWNGPEYVELRRAHIAGQVPGYCRQCYEE